MIEQLMEKNVKILMVTNVCTCRMCVMNCIARMSKQIMMGNVSNGGNLSNDTKAAEEEIGRFNPKIDY